MHLHEGSHALARRGAWSAFSSSSRATSTTTGVASTTTVRVHVYDLNANYNDLAYPIGLGIHHSAVEIYDREYAFGYHDDANVTGVFDIAPKSAPHPAKYRETIEIGTSLLTEDQFADALEALRRDFPGPSYDLLKRNCNTFTETMVKVLTGKSVPGYVNRLANLGAVAHDFAPCLLPTSIVGDLQTLPATTGQNEETEDVDGGEEVQLLAVPTEEMHAS